MPIQWGQHYSVEIERFDDDHRQLCALVNDLHEAVEAGKTKAQLKVVLFGLCAYAQQHFRTEEALMERTGYDGYAAHEQEHRQFTDKVQEFVRAQEIGDTGVALEVLIFLQHWLDHHIMETDRQYSEHFKAHGIR